MSHILLCPFSVLVGNRYALKSCDGNRAGLKTAGQGLAGFKGKCKEQDRFTPWSEGTGTGSGYQ